MWLVLGDKSLFICLPKRLMHFELHKSEALNRQYWLSSNEISEMVYS